MNYRIKLYLMNQKGLVVLAALIKTIGSSIIHSVIVSKDKAMVRDYYDEICDLCKKNSIIYYDRKNDISDQVNIAYCLAVGWRWMIKSGSKLIVLHDSLLPKYRGFSPLVNSLLNREPIIGVTALFACDRFDEGDIIFQESISIEYPMPIQTAIERISECYKLLACRIAACIAHGTPLLSSPQDHTKATYSPWLDDEDYRIDWDAPLLEVHHFIISVGFPFAGASSFVNGRCVRIIEAEPVDGFVMARSAPGKILFIDNGCPLIVTGSGLLRVTKIIDSTSRESLLPWSSLRKRFT